MTNDDHPSEILDALAHPHRRELLLALYEEGGRPERIDPVEVIADVVDDLEEGRIQLQHTHLPKLAERQLIEWDPQSGTVAPGPAMDDAAPVLEAVRVSESRAWRGTSE